ncbi:MAG: agmatinase [bacterium]
MKVVDGSRNFLKTGKSSGAFETSKVVILPIPYEHTVSFGGGTAKGPAAIIKASHYVEFYDEETRKEVHTQVGIATLPPINFGKKKDKPAIDMIEKRVTELLNQDKFVVSLGGEHTISAGTIAAHANKFPNLSVLHFDAHSDLRQEYQGNRYSHACVMARVCEFLNPHKLVQVGIRAQERPEAEFIIERGVQTFYAYQIRNGLLDQGSMKWDDRVVDALTDQVYISFDIDGLDPSIMPATGTPEPNGLLWDEVMRLLKKVGEKKTIVGFEVVEFAPIRILHHADLTAAKLVMKILNYAV